MRGLHSVGDLPDFSVKYCAYGDYLSFFAKDIVQPNTVQLQPLRLDTSNFTNVDRAAL